MPRPAAPRTLRQGDVGLWGGVRLAVGASRELPESDTQRRARHTGTWLDGLIKHGPVVGGRHTGSGVICVQTCETPR